MRTQFATSKRGGTRYMPFAFTEQGVAMLANVLKSKPACAYWHADRKARKTSVAIVRAFIALKKFVLNYQELAGKLKELETKYNKQFKDVPVCVRTGRYEAINYLLQKDKQETEHNERKRIGFRPDTDG